MPNNILGIAEFEVILLINFRHNMMLHNGIYEALID